MTYFPDLSSYTYLQQENAMLNVGWLDRQEAFTTGLVPKEVVEKLIVMADEQHNITRGLHFCQFCDEESPIILAADVETGSVALGMGELHVVGSNGITYSAPSLIIHYIIRHHYQPPAEFIDAVQSGRACPLDCS